jgi:dTDP-L-rhamnose 4-epimerase
MTRVLVTGGAGFIGSHTVDALLARGYEVRVLDLLIPPVHDGTVPPYVPKEVEFVRADVRDATAMRQALRDVSIVYHLAAYQDYLPDFSTFFSTNATATALLFELIVAEFRGVELVVVASSQAVYGEGRYLCAQHGAVYPGPRPEERLAAAQWEHVCPTCGGAAEAGWTDEAVMKPHNPYGLSKRDQDDLVTLLARRYKVPSTAFRYSIVQGTRQSFRNAYSGALRSFTVQLASGTAPLVYEDGRQLRDYVGIRDVIRANLMPLDRPEMHYRAFNVGGHRSVSVLELVQEVGAVTGHRLDALVPGIYRVGDTRHIRSDVSALESLGWSVRDSLRDVVKEYVEWAVASPGFRNEAAAAQERMRKLGVLKSVQVP